MYIGKKNEIRKLREDLYTNYHLVKKEFEISNGSEANAKDKETQIEKYNPLQFYKVIGKKKLFKTNDYTRISSKAAYFLEKILDEEKSQIENAKKNEKLNIDKTPSTFNHLQLRDIHNSGAIRTKLSTLSLFYLLPFLFVTKLSKLNSMGYMRFIFLIPFIAAYPSIDEGIKQYTTRKEAILMLFCLERFYKEDTEYYERYRRFMRENNLEFKEMSQIKEKNLVKV